VLVAVKGTGAGFCDFWRFQPPDQLGDHMTGDKTRRTGDARQTAEAAFKAATTKPMEPLPKKPTIPNAKEMVSLRIDRDVLEYFQEDGPGWQERINEALRRAAGK